MAWLDRIPNKRVLLGRGMTALGITRTLERLSRARGASLLVLIYHRIAEPAGDPYYEPVISATPDGFRAQLMMLRDRYRLLRLDEISRDGGLESLDRPSVLITFDDGYRDNAEVAAPLLKELGIPATFFLTTEFVQGVRLAWWDHVAYVIKQTARHSFSLDLRTEDADRSAATSPLAVDLGDGSPSARTTALMTIISAFLDGRVPDEARFLAQLDERAGVDVDAPRLGRELFMTWDQARALADDPSGLFAIGSHAVSHRRLAALDEAEQRDELAGSKRTLETLIGREVDTLAYPYGGPGAFDDRTERIAAEAGYRLGFSAIAGVPRSGQPLDLLRIPRFMIGSGDSASLLRARLALQAAVGRSFL